MKLTTGSISVKVASNITEFPSDVIVNPANALLITGGGFVETIKRKRGTS
ncbi:MAG: hypothetical protein QW438_03265 [Ignisphaera sp.]